jgi:hypothetical protein
LAELAVSVADLHAAIGGRVMPTVAEYLPRVRAAATPSSRRTYGTYWARMVAAWGRMASGHGGGDRCGGAATRLRPARGLAQQRPRRPACRHVGENVITAARAFFTRAIADGLIPAGASPALFGSSVLAGAPTRTHGLEVHAPAVNGAGTAG